MDKVRFLTPTKIGDTLYVEFEVINKQDHGARNGIITCMELVKNQRGEEVVVAEVKTLVAKQNSSKA